MSAMSENNSHMSGSLTHQLLHKIGAAIANNRYKDKTLLLTEAGICDEFEVSRSAAREVVKMLTAKGMLSSRPRHGITILERQHWNMLDSDVLHWLLESTPSVALLNDFLQLRLAIEPEAAALAAKTADKTQIASLGEALNCMRRADQGLEDALEADIRFHTQLLLASGNPFFMQFSRFIDTALRVSMRFPNNAKAGTSSFIQHYENIYNAIKNTNSVMARASSYCARLEALDTVKNIRHVEQQGHFGKICSKRHLLDIV